MISPEAANKKTSVAPDRFRIVFEKSVTLAVSFSGIKAFEKNKGVEVEWTASESNIDRYEVEKSVDANHFVLIDSLRAKAYAPASINYSWFDENPVNGNNFYRVKSVNYLGETKYTKWQKLL